MIQYMFYNLKYFPHSSFCSLQKFVMSKILKKRFFNWLWSWKYWQYLRKSRTDNKVALLILYTLFSKLWSVRPYFQSLLCTIVYSIQIINLLGIILATIEFLERSLWQVSYSIPSSVLVSQKILRAIYEHGI